MDKRAGVLEMSLIFNRYTKLQIYALLPSLRVINKLEVPGRRRRV